MSLGVKWSWGAKPRWLGGAREQDVLRESSLKGSDESESEMELESNI